MRIFIAITYPGQRRGLNQATIPGAKSAASLIGPSKNSSTSLHLLRAGFGEVARFGLCLATKASLVSILHIRLFQEKDRVH